MSEAGQAADESAVARTVSVEMAEKIGGLGCGLGLRDLVQWTKRQELYFASGPTVEDLPIGCYKFVPTDAGMALEKVPLECDELIPFPGGPCSLVLAGIENFWRRRREFVKRGQLFKRGVLLCGPAGSGKTSIVMLLAQQVMDHGGLVTITQNAGSALAGLALLRKVEPKRPIVNIIEDIDELLSEDGERRMLSLLDGEAQIDNIVHVGTTNHPEKLGARIIKRPSRFDEIIDVPVPDEEMRRLYLRNILRRDDLPKPELDRWVERTEGMSFAFLRELAVAVFCLGRPFEEVMDRLQGMLERPEPIEEWDRPRIGFAPPEAVRKV